MPRTYTQLTFTDSVKRAQEHNGTRTQAARMEAMEVADDRFGEREVDFIHARDSFYIASVGDNGWPYVQFRGGPTGFLRVLDEQTFAYADFRGNLQYITTGNLLHDDRVSLFLMDYPNRRRLKIMATATVHDAADRPDLVEGVQDPDYRARIERVIVYKLAAYDWNCPQHITPRWTENELQDRSETKS